MAGVYGVVAYTVGQRAGEIGLRMALGARSSDVLRLVLRQGVTLTAIGLAAGLTAAFAATRLLASMLFEVKATDARTYLGVATLLMLVSLVASYIPARRAVRVEFRLLPAAGVAWGRHVACGGLVGRLRSLTVTALLKSRQMPRLGKIVLWLLPSRDRQEAVCPAFLPAPHLL